MPDIDSSRKFDTIQEQHVLRSADVAFLRLVREPDGWKLMTATAGEDDVPLRACEDQNALLRAASEAMVARGIDAISRFDRFGRPYVEAKSFASIDDACHVAKMIFDRLGVMGFEVVELRCLRALHDDLAVDEDEDAYLSDGMWLTPDGRFVVR